MKVKSILTLTFLFVFFCNCGAQKINTKELLNKIDKAVNYVVEGQFILNEKLYTVSIGEDSALRNTNAKCYFRKLSTDSLIGYELASFRNDGYEQVYDGNTLLALTSWDKTLEIIDNIKYPNKIKGLSRDYYIFPFFKYLNESLKYFNKDTLLDKIKMVGIQRFKEKECYKIKTVTSPDTDSNQYEAYIFVSTTSFLPVGLYVRSESLVGQAKEIQIFDLWTSDFKAGAVPDKKFTKEALSEYNKETPYNPSSEVFNNPLLPIGTQAPEWELSLLNGTNLRLSDLRGKIVIMDFWYKKCPPCRKQMIALQKLHNKYDKTKVIFVGINTIDDPIKDKLELFLKNRNITMTSVYNGKAIENSYKIYASPALYIINKEGKIVHTAEGYSDTLLEDVSKIIEQQL